MERVILHCDANAFYASVECLYTPSIRHSPVAVCGSVEERHGIVLTKNQIAKQFGVQTGEAIWQARQKCPGLICVPPDYALYIRFSRRMRRLYEEYSDHVESFGLDEAWIDLSNPGLTIRDGERIGHEIRLRVKRELGITVSVGVSFNKIFAKLGSDMKKPDAVTAVGREDYKQKIWPLPVSDLLFVGRATAEKLKRFGISTIGALAAADREMLAHGLGKWGVTLSAYARGEDDSPVRGEDEQEDLKSVGNSLTYFEDITKPEDIKRLLYALSESVAARIKDAGLGKADTVHLWVRDCDLDNHSWQKKVRPTALCGEIAEAAFALYTERYKTGKPVRGLGVTASGFDGGVEQLSFDSFGGDYEKKARAEEAVGKIRQKYGYAKIQRGIMFEDARVLGMDVRGQRLKRPAGGQDKTKKDDTE